MIKGVILALAFIANGVWALYSVWCERATISGDLAIFGAITLCLLSLLIIAVGCAGLYFEFTEAR